MQTDNRPLSPHLQIYRLPMAAKLSIMHRGTGVVLSIGSLFLVYWLIALASGPEAFAQAQALMGSWLGRLVLLGFSFALFFHLCTGIRHLFWDAVIGVNIETAEKSNWVVLIGSILLTVLAWVLAYSMGGA